MLKDFGIINRGLITGDRDKYFSKDKETIDHVPIIAGTDVHRYSIHPSTEFVLFKRPATSGGCWDREVHFAAHKLVVRQIGVRPTASLLREPIAVTGNLFTVRGSSEEQELYLLGIINSSLIEFFWRIMFSDFKNSFPQVTIFSLSQLPIRPINFSDPTDKARHDQMVSLAERMLRLHKDLAEAKSPNDKVMLERQIKATDEAIDRLVYELYGLTEEEIRVVEG